MEDSTKRLIRKIVAHLENLLKDGVSLSEDVDLKSAMEEVLLGSLTPESARAFREDLSGQDVIDFVDNALAGIHKVNEWSSKFRSSLMDSLDSLFLSVKDSKAFLAHLGI